mgnify:CR=1 FL=1
MRKYQTSESLPVGLLLALAGGILDSYSYLNRGQVFATAETGNLVLLGINLSQGNWQQVLHYLLPILAFAAGVLATELLRRQMGPNAGHLHWRQPILLVECGVLVLVSFLPQGGLDPVANMLISFTSAVQIESFRKFHGCACATTMCTGNLRSGTERLYLWGKTGERDHGHRAAQYYGIIVFFIVGAALGAWCSGRWGQRAVLGACVLLLAAFLLMFQRKPLARTGKGV